MIPASVLFVHSSDELYGADRVLLEMLSALPERTRAEVWLPTDQSQHHLCLELERRGVAYRHLDLPIMRRAYLRPLGLFRLAARTLLLVARFLRARPAAVYCTTSAALLAAPAARLARVPQVFGHLQEVWSDLDRRILGRLARCCHRLIAVSSWAAKATGPRLGRRAVVVANATPEPAIRSSLAGRTGPLAYVVASRWGMGKGYATLLQAWDRLDAPSRLIILGGPPPSGGRVDVPGLIGELRRPDTVSVVGEVGDSSAYLEAADVVLVPSDYPEGFGLVAIEGFAHGRPVIASSAGGLVDVVADRVDGWLFPPGDVAALTDLLQSIDRLAVTEAGAAARNTYERRFTSAAFGERWREACETGFAAKDPESAQPGARITR